MNVFDQNPQVEQPNPVADTPVQDYNPKEEIEKLAKRLNDKDEYIQRLQNETAELRKEVEAVEDIKELLKNNVQGRVPQEQPQQKPDAQNPAQVQAINPKDLEDRIREVTRQDREVELATRNINAVGERLVASYGDAEKAKNAVAAKAAELGVSVQFLQDAAAKSPNAFYNLIGLSGEAPKSTPRSQSDVNTLSMRSNGNDGKRNYAYYKALREANKKQYFSPSVQNQMHKDAIEQGSAFYN